MIGHRLQIKRLCLVKHDNLERLEYTRPHFEALDDFVVNFLYYAQQININQLPKANIW